MYFLTQENLTYRFLKAREIQQRKYHCVLALLFYFFAWILVVRHWVSIQGWPFLPSHCPAKSTFSWRFCNWIWHHIFFLLAYLEETWLHSFRETCACLGKPKRKALFYPLSIASPPISHLLPPSNAWLAMKACSISLPAVTSHRRPLEGSEMLLTTIRSAQRCGSTLLP